jgi:hypothetical protein
MLKPNPVTRCLSFLAWPLRRARWPWAGLLLALALSLGAAGSTPAVQAAHVGDYHETIYVVVTKSGSNERTICVGDKVDVQVRVFHVVEVLDAGEGAKQFGRLLGVPLQASVADPGVGAISPAASTTPIDGDSLGQAKFTFTAKAAGATSVKVDAKLIHNQFLGVVLNSDTVTGELPLTVEKCAYRIHATLVWKIKGLITAVAQITDAALAPDGNGNYTGNADVEWSTTNAVPGRCHVIEHGPAPSRVFVTGESLGSDVLEVKMTFEPTQSMTSTMVCPERSVAMPGSVSVTPEDMRMWFLTTGGTALRRPTLQGAETSSAIAVVTLVPESAH